MYLLQVWHVNRKIFHFQLQKFQPKSLKALHLKQYVFFCIIPTCHILWPGGQITVLNVIFYLYYDHEDVLD